MDWLKEQVKHEMRHEFQFSLSHKQSHIFHGLFTGYYTISNKLTDELYGLHIEGHRHVNSLLWRVKLRVNIVINTPKEECPPLKHETEVSFDVDTRQSHLKSWETDFLKAFYNTYCETMTCVVTIKVLEHHGLPNSDIVSMMERVYNTTDLCLIVEDKPINVQKTFICLNSNVFQTMLCGGRFKESTEKEIEIKDVSYDKFSMFLAVMHGFHPNSDCETYDYLFELCDRFDTPWLRNTLINSLTNLDIHEIIHFLMIANKYTLAKLEEIAVESIKTMDDLYVILENPLFEQLHTTTRSFVINSVCMKTSRPDPFVL